MESILKHKTTDGMTYHEVDIINKKHKVTTLETTTTEEHSTNKKWGTQQKFVEKLVLNEISVVEEKMLVQKKTIADCIYYGSESNLDITKIKLNKNRELLEFLTTYEYGTK
jgi:hypothetical protein